MNSTESSSHRRPSRREFLKTAAAATVAGAALAGPQSILRNAHAAGGDLLRVGLVGCGGRGTGAAREALQADKNVKLTAMADLFGDRLEASLSGQSSYVCGQAKSSDCWVQNIGSKRIRINCPKSPITLTATAVLPLHQD